MAQNRGDPTQAFWAKKYTASPGTASAPAYTFGNDIDTGFFSSTPGYIDVSIGGLTRWQFFGNNFQSDEALGPYLSSGGSSAATPNIIPNRSDGNSGLAQAGGIDTLSMIVGGKEGFRVMELLDKVIIAYPEGLSSAITAYAGGAQTNAVVLTSTFNIVTVSGTNGDSVKLPATFPVGTLMYIMNADAAQTIDVFPASGDDIGAGTNNAINIAAGGFLGLIASVADATWAKFAG